MSVVAELVNEPTKPQPLVSTTLEARMFGTLSCQPHTATLSGTPPPKDDLAPTTASDENRSELSTAETSSEDGSSDTSLGPVTMTDSMRPPKTLVPISKLEQERKRFKKVRPVVIAALKDQNVQSMMDTIWQCSDEQNTAHTNAVRICFSKVGIFNFRASKEIGLVERETGFTTSMTMPFHILAAATLLQGANDSVDFLVSVNRMWVDIIKTCQDKCGVYADSILDAVVAQHARTATKRYKMILLASTKAFMCKTRSGMFKSWINDLVSMISREWEARLVRIALEKIQKEMAEDIADCIQTTEEEDDEAERFVLEE